MKPSRLSCLCWLKFIFFPMASRSNKRGGSDIIIYSVISPTFLIKSTICWLISSFSLSAMARTPWIFRIRPSQNGLFIAWDRISLQLLWYFFLRTFEMLRSIRPLQVAYRIEASTGQKCCSIWSITGGIECWKKYTTPSRLSSWLKMSKNTSWQSHL